MGQGSKHEGVERYAGPEGITWTARASKRLPSGKRVFWRDTFTTEGAAVKARRAWLAEQESGEAVAPSRIALAAAATTWLETYPQTKAPKTAFEYTRIVTKHILPSALAAVPLQRLDPGRIQDWYNGLDVGARTRELIHLRLCQILDMAVIHKRIKSNPARECHVPRPVPRRGTLLRAEQTAAFLAVARQDFYHPLWDVAVATGFRRGEVLGLRWRDLDLERGNLAVRHTVIWISKPSAQERAKTESSYRSIRIPPDVVAMLRAHAEQQGTIRERTGDRWEGNDLVFCTRHGRPLSPNNVHRTFKALLAAAGLPHTIKIHDLRHTNLSHLLNNGVPITTVARRGGYRNPSVLLSIYAHADDEQDAIAADVAGALTQGASPKTDAHE